MILGVRGLFVIVGDRIPRMAGDDSRIKHKFGARVRAIRQTRSLSQEALALASELDRTYIGGVERGERNISLLNIYKIAAALGVEPSELLK